MPRIDGLRVPHDFYWIFSDPVPLAGMAFPSWPPMWQRLFTLGFRHVVCLTHDRPPYDPSPLSILFSVQMEDLIGQPQPLDPAGEARRVEGAVAAALSRLGLGEGVIVHCAAGTGRTGTVLGCMLRRLGMPGRETIRYLDRVNRQRGQDGWPESPWQAAMVEWFSQLPE
ncbi:MAG: hypothetical protein AB1449_02470 [Chloroflexota bacterium]